MGRTVKRRKRKVKSAVPLHNLEYCIRLERWVKERGMVKGVKSRIARFESTGRGVMALEKVRPGDVLVSVPAEAVLCLRSVARDDRFVDMLRDSGFAKKIARIELLSLYVAYLKIIGSETFWAVFVESLPSDELSVPYFEFKDDRMNVDETVADIVLRQKKVIHESFSIFAESLKKNAERFVEEFTLSLYEWAYFAVNSRCIYLESYPIDETGERFVDRDLKYLSELVSDDVDVGLIPYLDMFNHSGDVSARFVLNVSDRSPNRDPRYELITETAFDKYSQIFISYGPHCNLRLSTEYGFVLENNRFSNVPFAFERVCDLLKLSKANVSRERYRYLTKHRIFENLYVAKDGFSFNLRRLLYILSSDDSSKWNRLTFAPRYDKIDSDRIDELGRIVLERRKAALMKSLDCALESESERNSDAFKNYIKLLNEYVNIIDCVLENIFKDVETIDTIPKR